MAEINAISVQDPHAKAQDDKTVSIIKDALKAANEERKKQLLEWKGAKKLKIFEDSVKQKKKLEGFLSHVKMHWRTQCKPGQRRRLVGSESRKDALEALAALNNLENSVSSEEDPQKATHILHKAVGQIEKGEKSKWQDWKEAANKKSVDKKRQEMLGLRDYMAKANTYFKTKYCGS